MRFVIDMPVSPLLAEWLQEEKHDAIHASYAGLGRASDKEIISRARKENRIIVLPEKLESS